jgi:hypothetical protein
MSTSWFRLEQPNPDVSTASPSSASSSFQFLTFSALPQDPSPPNPHAGSFEYDLASSNYPLRWESWTEFKNWLAKEEHDQGIEL